jgi:hypothetical protein
MAFDIRTIVSSIKNTSGYFYPTCEILNYSYTCLIKEKCLMNNRKNYLAWDKTRMSKIMSGEEYLYKTLTQLVEVKGTKDILLKNKSRIYKDVFDEIDGNEVIKKLILAMNEDLTFNPQLKKIINSGKLSNEEIYCELLYYCLEVDNKKNQFNISKMKRNKAGKIIIETANISIIGKMIFTITKNQRINAETKEHFKSWTLEDKLKRNKISKALSEQIKDSFDNYNYVLDALDDLRNEDYMVEEHLYSYYKKIYWDVLNELFVDDYNDDDILEKSSFIFKKINQKVYDVIYKDYDKYDDSTIEELELNLMSITATVFYQCKFLLPLEEF